MTLIPATTAPRRVAGLIPAMTAPLRRRGRRSRLRHDPTAQPPPGASWDAAAGVDPDFGVDPPVDPGYDGPTPPSRPVDPEFGVTPPVDPGWGTTHPRRIFRLPPEPRSRPLTRVGAPPPPVAPAGPSRDGAAAVRSRLQRPQAAAAGRPARRRRRPVRRRVLAGRRQPHPAPRRICPPLPGRRSPRSIPVTGLSLPVDPGWGHTPPHRPEVPIDPGYGNVDPGYGHTPPSPAPLCPASDCPLRPPAPAPAEHKVGWRELFAVAAATLVTVNALTVSSLTPAAKLWVDAVLAILVAIAFLVR